MSGISLVGPQILSEDMLDCAFHYRSDVLATIENFRSNAAEVSMRFSEALRTREQEAIMLSRGFNNTISILGSRGSGKTSIIMTLQKLLSESGDSPRQDRAFRNIMMPILIPQDIEPEQKLLSCIISQLLRKAESIELELQRGECAASEHVWHDWRTQPRSSGVPDDPFRTCMDRLLSAFELRFQSSQTAQHADVDQVYFYMDSVKRDADLLADMLKLISMIVDYYRYQQARMPLKPPAEPLMFFTIDDLDLTPHRSSEVLDLVLRYLQHPNVVVICGWNHELFQNHLCMDILNTQGVLAADLLNINFSFDDVFMYRYRNRTTALDSARRLAVDNLKKAFPPSQRFEIRGLSTQERASFPYSLSSAGKDQSSQKDTLFYWMEETIRQCARLSGAAPKSRTFLRTDYNERLDVYMRIFDNKVRGLANSRRAFESLALYLRKKQEELAGVPEKTASPLDITGQIKILFDAILFSNTRFLPYRRGLRDLVQIKKVVLPHRKAEGVLDYYCNFQAVRRTLEKYREEQEQKESLEIDTGLLNNAEYTLQQKYDYFPNLIVDVFLLLNFMENFLHTITGTRGSTHGGRAFSAYLNELHPPINFSATSEDLLSQAILVSGVQALKLFPDTADFALNVAILDAYERAGFEETQYYFTGFLCLMRLFNMVKRLLPKKRELDMEAVRKILQADPAWLSTILRLLNALQPRDENIMRLAVYSSILESSQSHEDAMKQASLCGGWSWDRLEGPVRSRLDFTDDTLDTLVQCLRTIDKNRTYFLQCKQRGTLGRVRRSGEDQAAYRRAETYCGLSAQWPWHDLAPDAEQDFIFIQVPTQLSLALAPLSERKKAVSADDPKLNTSKPLKDDDMDTVLTALEWADHDISILLHDLKVRMRRALTFNYENCGESLTQRSQYLSRASVAVRKYFERWELIPGSWGQREIKAASDLVTVFQRYLLDDMVNDMLVIMDLGPALGEERRDRYNNKVGTLRQKVNGYSGLFTAEELDRIRDDFITLSEAPKQIRRGLRIEEDIYNTVIDIGVLVAQEFGIVSRDLFKEWSQNAEKRLSVWPVSPAYDRELDALAKYFNQLLSQKSAPYSTMFDVEYSDIDLYLRNTAGE